MPLTGIVVVSNALERLKIVQAFKYCHQASLKEDFSTAVEAREYLRYHTVDFVAIKPDLPVYNGFEFIATLHPATEVLLISHHPSDALKAYELGLVDCLPHPFTKQRLEISLERILEKNKQKKIPIVERDTNVVVRCNLKNEKVALDRILWIEAMGDYIRIVTEDKNLIILSTMKEFIKRLPSSQFFRTHKSFIVNLQKVQFYRINEVEISGKKVPLSRTRKKAFEEIYLADQ